MESLQAQTLEDIEIICVNDGSTDDSRSVLEAWACLLYTSSKTVILVTHSMDAVKKYCNKAILIKDGEIVVSGDKDDVADRYTLENLKREEKRCV